MAQSPPPFGDQARVDAEHLNLLGIFHYIVAGLAVLGMGFLVLHYLIFNAILNDPRVWAAQKNQALPPREFFWMFQVMYDVFGICLLLAAVCNFLSGWYLRERMHRTFSIVVAGLNCVQVPIGTALGVFTIIVLMRDSVRALYDAPSG